MAKRLKKVNNDWKFKGKKFTMTYDEILEQGWYGFVYLITDKERNKKYIGEKSFHSFRTPKGKKNKKKFESNWAEYPTSNKLLQKFIRLSEEERNEKFDFVILALAKDKAIMKYVEVRYMMQYNVCGDESFYNDNVKINVLTTYKDYNERVLE